jgi:phage repressor protein C with HTH and peptisase S24 domain
MCDISTAHVNGKSIAACSAVRAVIVPRMDIVQRIKHRLEVLGKSARGASLEAGLSSAFIRNILQGKALSPRGENLSKIARALHTSEVWLMRGEGPEDAENDPTAVQSVHQPEPPPPPSGIPEFEVFAGASYAGGMDDEQWNDGGASGHRPIATWGFPASFVEAELGLRIGHADIIKIKGDSMDDGSARGLASGDRVLIDRRDTDPRQGGIFAVWDGEGVVVKRVEIVRGTQPPQIVCKSLNPGFDPFTLTLGDGHAHIIGRVAGKITRM